MLVYVSAVVVYFSAMLMCVHAVVVCFSVVLVCVGAALVWCYRVLMQGWWWVNASLM